MKKIKHGIFLLITFFAFTVKASSFSAYYIDLQPVNIIDEGFQVQVEKNVLSLGDGILLVSVYAPLEKKGLRFFNMHLSIYEKNKSVFESILANKAEEKERFYFFIECQKLKDVRLLIPYRYKKKEYSDLVYRIEDFWSFNPALKKKMPECR